MSIFVLKCYDEVQAPAEFPRKVMLLTMRHGRHGRNGRVIGIFDPDDSKAYSLDPNLILLLFVDSYTSIDNL